jgi:ketosteroid isomerase-like protein
MEYLSEDPTVLTGALVVVAVAFLIATRVTQQGKYLFLAGGAFSLAILVVLVEWFWITDTERIEAVVYDLGKAVEASDAQGVLKHLTSDVQYSVSGASLSSEQTRYMIEQAVSNVHIDFLRISQLEASAMQQSRRGKAEFKVLASGSFSGAGGLGGGAGTGNSRWSLGFQETSPNVWKVNRITPQQFPGGLTLSPPRSRPESSGPILPTSPPNAHSYGPRPSRSMSVPRPGSSR